MADITKLFDAGADELQAPFFKRDVDMSLSYLYSFEGYDVAAYRFEFRIGAASPNDKQRPIARFTRGIIRLLIDLKMRAAVGTEAKRRERKTKRGGQKPLPGEVGRSLTQLNT